MDPHRLSPGRFYGERQNARRAGGLTLTESVYTPGLELPRHAHPLAYFCVVLGGSYHERYGSRARDCAAPMLIFHPEGETHSDHFDRAGGHVFSIETDAGWLARVRELAPVLRQPSELHTGDAYALGVKLFREFAEPGSGSALAIEGLTLEILSCALRSAPREEQWRPRWLKTAEEYLRAHYTEEIGLEALAAAAGVHPSHLARTFRAHHRCTAGEYVRRLRIERACLRLRDREATLAGLASELGFNDQSHFGRLFKRYTGQTPAEYRRALSLPWSPDERS